MNLDFAKVCGKHSAVYEAYYKQIDPKGSGAIEAMTAAKFLKKSGLSDVVLSRVWDMSDPNGKGFLDKPGFFVALKLVSLAQAGQVFNMGNIYMETVNPPKVGELPKIIPARIPPMTTASGVANSDWSISVIDRLKYEQLFESLKPAGGMLTGNKVKGVLMDSKLPMETLGQIWDLADQDKDGNLDKHEFIVAMHLVYQTLQKRIVPNVLPPELRKTDRSAVAGGPPPKPAPPAAVMPRAPSGEGFGDSGFVANFPKDIAPPPAIPPLPVAVPPMTRIPPVGAVSAQPLIQTDPLIPIGAPPSVTANADWVVTASEMQRFEIMFRDSDRDKDGLVSGLEVKNIFIQSGVPQKCLAHIWALCDTNQSGKLTLEQFALAMWMVERKQKGLEPPQVLNANMVPPSMRSIVSGIDMQTQEPKPTYTNPELEMISKEIEELSRERRALETEIAQKDADIRIKTGEVRSLQSELDTLSATLKQLEHQRGEAQKRLDDLKAQGFEYQTELSNLNLNISQVRNQVNKIREQCQKQEDTINEQEGELNAKRSELQKLKDEEIALQNEYDDNNRELQKLTQHLQNTQLQISSVRSMVTQLMETQRQMTDALLICRAAIDSQNAELVSEYQLKIEPDLDEVRKAVEKKLEEPKTIDPFGGNIESTTKTSNGFASNGFGSDPFTGHTNATNTITAGFDDSFHASSGFDSGFDAFGNSNSAFDQQPTRDPFGGDAFGANKITAITPEPGKDDFGSDPFAALHAPTGQGQVLSPNTQRSGPPPRPESPSPALPPKKSKVPPPRPAPPRPLQAPARTTQPSMDAFGTIAPSGGGFADFADFDNKLTTIPTPSTTQTLFGNLTLFDTLQYNTMTTTAVTAVTAVTAAATTNAITDTTTAFTLKTTSTATTTTTSSSSSSLASSASASSTTNTLTATNANNHLTRSTTPLQQAASMFDTIHMATTTLSTAPAPAPATTTITNNNQNNGPADQNATLKTNSNDKTLISGPTDFKDDPFKDYRYEDPFNIVDPFADDENIFADTSKAFKDDFSSDDDQTNTVVANQTNMDNLFETQLVQQKGAATTPLSNDFIQQFDAFKLATSPVTSLNNATASSDNKSNHNNSNNKKINQSQTATLNAFGENVAIGGGGGAGADGGSAVAVAAIDAFADFDAFTTTSTANTQQFNTENQTSFNNKNINNSNNNNTTATTTATTTNITNDSFFDAFNDNFKSNNIYIAADFENIATKPNNSNAANRYDAFDAFSTTATAGAAAAAAATAATTTNTNNSNSGIDKISPLFDAFNDNTFEDDFFKTSNSPTEKDNNKNLNINFIDDKINNSSSNNNNTNNSCNNETNKTIDRFSKFDDFVTGADTETVTVAAALNNSKNYNGSDTATGTSAIFTPSMKSNKSLLAAVQNQTTLAKTPNHQSDGGGGGGGAKLAQKFAADYSNPDSFDADLEEAMRRSILDM